VSAPFNGTCLLSINWSPGTQTCGAVAPVYNVYRSTTAGFTPTAANRIATCVTGQLRGQRRATPSTTYSLHRPRGRRHRNRRRTLPGRNQDGNKIGRRTPLGSPCRSRSQTAPRAHRR
jgi:hypothetical protein